MIGFPWIDWPRSAGMLVDRKVKRMIGDDLIFISYELDKNGLVWHPEIGDEVIERREEARVSILVDPQGLSPEQLREAYLWLPTMEQLVSQIEVRQGLLYHVGKTTDKEYETVVKTAIGLIRTQADSIRTALGLALKDLLAHSVSEVVH